MPNLKERIKAHFDKRNKRDRQQGQGATVAAAVCETVYFSGLVDNHPKLQLACHIGAIIFGAIAGNKMRNTIKPQNDEPIK